MYTSDVCFEWKAWISQAGLSSEWSSLYIVPQPPAMLVPPLPVGRAFLEQHEFFLLTEGESDF